MRVRLRLKVVLDEETWRLVETLAALDGVTWDEAVRRAVHAQAAVRA